MTVNYDGEQTCEQRSLVVRTCYGRTDRNYAMECAAPRCDLAAQPQRNQSANRSCGLSRLAPTRHSPGPRAEANSCAASYHQQRLPSLPAAPSALRRYPLPGQPSAAPTRFVRLEGRIVGRVVVNRPAARNPAGDGPVTAAGEHHGPGRPAVTWLPGHDYPARSPLMPAGAAGRVVPPVRQPRFIHPYTRTRIR